jgi:hypothetical protein
LYTDGSRIIQSRVVKVTRGVIYTAQLQPMAHQTQRLASIPMVTASAPPGLAALVNTSFSIRKAVECGLARCYTNHCRSGTLDGRRAFTAKVHSNSCTRRYAL